MGKFYEIIFGIPRGSEAFARVLVKAVKTQDLREVEFFLVQRILSRLVCAREIL